MIQTLHDTGDDYTALSKYDGGVYSLGAPDAVIAGIGDEFSINYQSDSLNVTFNAGSEAVIGGAFFKVTSLEAVTLVANSTIYLCANIDLSRPNGQTGQFVQRTSSNMQSDNINGSGTSRDLLLYVVTTGVSGVISVSDRRPIKENIVGDLADVALSGSYNDLTNKPEGVLTIQKNGTNVATFSASETTNKTANITVPTKVSDLTNDSKYIKGINVGSVLSNQSWSGDKYTSHSLSWTATQDAWVFLTGYEAAPNAVRLNNTVLWNYSSGTDGHHPFGPIFVKAGQTISITSIVQCTLRAFAAS